MSIYSKETKRYHQSRVKAVLIISPSATIREIQKSLEASEKAPLQLSEDYITNLKRKIIGERLTRHDKATIKARIAQLQDKLEKINEQLWQIAGGASSEQKDKIAALKALAENDLKLLQAEMDAGIFTRQLGNIDLTAKRNLPIDEDHEKRILNAFGNWGFIEAEATEIKTQPHDQIKTLPQANSPGSSSKD